MAADPAQVPLTAHQIAEKIQVQMDLRAKRDRKRKLEALDKPTVNIQALEIIRKHTEASTKMDSLSEVPETPPNVDKAPSSGIVPPSSPGGSIPGTPGDAGVLLQEANGVEAGSSPGESRPDDGGKPNNRKGKSRKGMPKSDFLQ